jgi:hypothetical protein
MNDRIVDTDAFSLFTDPEGRMMWLWKSNM